jgi:phage virion morphogenesis protein
VITLTIDDDRLKKALQDLISATGDPSAALLEIGAEMVERTKRRFETGTAPDGVKWQTNRPVTLARKAPQTRPLIGETGVLMDTIRHQLIGNDTLLVGSNQEYAAAQQFGMPKGYAGKTERGDPIPWGDIPPRPFLGLSEDDHREILDILADHLRDAL